MANKQLTKELPAGREPAADLRDEELVVLHVLKHLYAHHAVEGSLVLLAQVELIDVARDHADVAEPSLLW